MRLWPRGVKKAHIDAWERDLAPPLELLQGFLAGDIAWSTYKRKYLSAVKKQASAKLAELRARVAAGETITLLCWCHDEERCHRSLLRDLLEE